MEFRKSSCAVVPGLFSASLANTTDCTIKGRDSADPGRRPIKRPAALCAGREGGKTNTASSVLRRLKEEAEQKTNTSQEPLWVTGWWTEGRSDTNKEKTSSTKCFLTASRLDCLLTASRVLSHCETQTFTASHWVKSLDEAQD